MESCCPICTESVPFEELERHVNQHLDREEQMNVQDRNSTQPFLPRERGFQQGDPIEAPSSDLRHFSVDDDHMYCSSCACGISIGEWDSHCLQHQLQSEELAAQAEAQERHQRWLQENAEAPDCRPGTLDVAKVMHREDPQTRPLLAEEVENLVRRQSRAEFHSVQEGIMSLLRRCLEAESQGFMWAALSGHVDHYCTRRLDDFGWGCGWRNIQMLCSHLLRRDEGSKKALFGGAGFVPEISSLQLWLEIAWKKGFDKVGAEQLAHKVSSTHKWIGTTECAALLRSFGFRARIVDFKSSSQGDPHRQQARQECQDQALQDSNAREETPHEGTGPSACFKEDTSNSRCGNADKHRELASPHPSRAQSENFGINSRGGESCAGSIHGNGNRKDEGRGQVADVVFDMGVDEKETSWSSGEFCGRKRVRESNGNMRKEGKSTSELLKGIGDSFSMGATRSPQQLEEGEEHLEIRTTDVNHLAKGGVSAQGPSTRQRSWWSKGADGMVAGVGDNTANLATQHMELVQWVWEYFTEGRRQKGGVTNAFNALGQQVHMSNKPPLYFQHQGHSRTIVGIERRRKPGGTTEEVFLLVLDPSQRTDELERVLRQCRGWQRMVKRGIHTLRKAEYQLCYVDPGIAQGSEWEQLKVLESVLHAY